MTVTVKPRVTVHETGDPALTLPTSSASLAFDSGATPYVTAALACPADLRATTWGAGDLSTGADTRLTITADLGAGTPSQTADLVVRSRTINWADGTVQVQLASDEWLLMNYAPDSDVQLIDHQVSIRDLVQAVLEEAIDDPGTLQPGPDLSLPAVWNTSNVLANPDMALPMVFGEPWYWYGDKPWYNAKHLSQVAVSGEWWARWQATNVGWTWIESNTSTAREEEIWSARIKIGATGGLSMAIGIAFLDEAGMVLRVDWGDTYAAASQAMLTLTSEPAPARTARVNLRCSVRLPNTSTAYAWASGGCLSNDVEPQAFTGNRPDDLMYFYTWADKPNESASNRTVRSGDERPRELYIWRAGTTAWEFLQPLVAAAGLRLWCDEQRRWWLLDPKTHTDPRTVSPTLARVAAATDTDTADADYRTDMVRIRWHWRDRNGRDRERIEIAGVAGRTKNLDINQVYPGRGTAAAHLAKITGGDTDQTLTCVSDTRARPWQHLSHWLISDTHSPLRTGQITGVDFDLGEGLMTIRTPNLNTAIHL